MLCSEYSFSQSNHSLQQDIRNTINPDPDFQAGLWDQSAASTITCWAALHLHKGAAHEPWPVLDSFLHALQTYRVRCVRRVPLSEVQGTTLVTSGHWLPLSFALIPDTFPFLTGPAVAILLNSPAMIKRQLCPTPNGQRLEMLQPGPAPTWAMCLLHPLLRVGSRQKV